MGFAEQATLSEDRDFRIKVRQAVIAEARKQAKPTATGKRKKLKKRQDAAFMILRGGNYIKQFWPIVAEAVDGKADASDKEIADAVAEAFDEIAMVTADDDSDETSPVVREPALPPH